MNAQVTMDQRLSCYGLDSEKASLLKDFRETALKALPGILDDFYDFVTSHAVSQAIFAGKDIDHLKRAQTEHWSDLLTGTFDGAYRDRSVLIGKTHEKSGVTQFLYIGGYSIVLNRLSSLVIETCGRNTKKCERIIHAITSAVLMDMEFALSSYADASNQSQGARDSTEFANNILDQTVDLSIAINEVSIENAEMLNALQQVSEESQSIAAAVEEMVVGAKSISDNSQTASENARSAQEATSQGRDVLNETAQNMTQISEAVSQGAERVHSLADASTKIAEMVQTIEDIASQTNLLALNATIEAARAGEAGKGFAVVASEVKNLSTQTAKATEDIRDRITQFTSEIESIVSTMARGSEAVEQGQSAMQATVDSMGNIEQSIDSATGRMAEIANILGEQQSASNEVSGGVNRIAERADRNVEGIQKTVDAISKLDVMIASQIAKLAEFDIPNKAVRIAKSDHIVWKKKLADMMAGRTSLNADELSSHEHCRLGKWYYGPASLAYRNHPAFQNLEDPHKQVHQCGIEAVRRFNAGDRDGALEQMHKVEEASVDVLRLLDDLINTSVEEVLVELPAAANF